MIANLRNRLLRKIGIKPAPTEVEQASRREQWRRQAWMIGSLLGSFVIVAAPVQMVMIATGWFPTTQIGSVSFTLLFFAAVALIESRLFAWGFERFDLVAPWQFREAGHDE